MKAGEKVIYFYRRPGNSGYLRAEKLSATIIKIGAERVTIELEDGKRKNVLGENLQVIK